MEPEMMNEVSDNERDEYDNETVAMSEETSEQDNHTFQPSPPPQNIPMYQPPLMQQPPLVQPMQPVQPPFTQQMLYPMYMQPMPPMGYPGTASGCTYEDMLRSTRFLEEKLESNQRRTEADISRNTDMVYRHLDILGKQINLLSDRSEIIEKKLDKIDNKNRFSFPRNNNNNSSGYGTKNDWPRRRNRNRGPRGLFGIPENSTHEEFIFSFDDVFAPPSGPGGKKSIEGSMGNPMGLISTLFSSIGPPKGLFGGMGEKKEKETNYDSDEYEEVSEYGSDDEFEELDLNIETLDDLIKLGELYPKLKEVEEQNKKIETESNGVEESDGKSDKKVEDKDIVSLNNVRKDSSEDEMRKVFRKMGMPENSINLLIAGPTTKNSFMAPNKPPEIDFSLGLKSNKKEEDTENSTTANDNSAGDNSADALKKRSSCYELNGKLYSINLEILHKLVKPLQKLKAMVGLEDVKESVVNFVLYNIQCFETVNNSMHHVVIEGPPGVGKTKLGKILAQIYAAMRLVKTSKFVIARRTDLIGEYVGHTGQKTQSVIDDANGGVLFIDEAYSLGNEDKRDTFSKECLDVLNQNLSDGKKNFICIIAGYPDELEKCFFSANPGLKRRFPFRFTINEYTATELKDIFMKKINDSKWKLVDEKFDENKLLGFFKENMKNFPYFGGDMENLFTECKLMHSKRVAGLHPKHKRRLNRDDITNGFDNFMKNKKKTETHDFSSLYT